MALLVFLLSAPACASEEGKKDGLVVVPFVFYTPETAWAGGLPLIYYYRGRDAAADSRPNSLNLLMFQTELSQSVIQLTTENYARAGLYRINGGLYYSNYPNKFYGIGNDTRLSDEEGYTSEYSKAELRLLRRLYRFFYAGLQGEYERNRVLEPQEGGILESGGLIGSGGGLFAGGGLLAQWDSRDSIFFPAEGSFHQISAKKYARIAGGDFDFETYTVDIRKYVRLYHSHVLALQGYGEFLAGDAPFNRLAKIGGPTLMRGYFQGRFRDKNLLALQAEYRMTLWRRLGLAGVLSAGEVAGQFGDFSIDGIKRSYGAGLRYLLDPKEKINLRLDAGWGEGDSGVYLVFLEAF